VKSAVVYVSVHHGNTEKVAKVIAKTLKAKLFRVSDASAKKLEDYKLIGFGSGIYFVRHHQTLMKFVEKLPENEGKKAFIFSTAGVKKRGYATMAHKPLRDSLKSKKFDVIDEFNCPGHDTYSILKFIGGINKGRPNKDDLEKAEQFAKGLK
jgi:flavodoxin